ncbi:MAG: SDR family oxidoreductase [Planctomycetota bacterium]|jgi:3-oxoacyl-[acyl-carrier protein] reductase
MKFKGATALVTGGSEGIGRGIAEALLAEGATVGITGRREDVLSATAEEIGASAFVGDVGLEDDAARTVSGFVEKHGRLDILVNNAGYGYFAPLVELEMERFEAMFRTNVFGAMLMAREAAKHWVEKGEGGHLVNIGSTSGLKGGPRATAYSASKFALRSMSECWRAELRPHDVRVIQVNPSEVLTGFGSKVGYQQEPNPKKLRPEEIADAVVGALKVDNRGFIPEFAVFATNPF